MFNRFIVKLASPTRIRLARSIFFESKHKYFSLQKSMEELRNEGISKENADILYENENFRNGLQHLIEKNFPVGLGKLQKSLDELSMAGNDFPDILATVLKRIAVCYLNMQDNDNLEATLKEILLLRISDPEVNHYQIFQAAYNLAVYYQKNDPDAGIKLLTSLPEMLENKPQLPLPLDGELKTILGTCYLRKEEFREASKIFEEIVAEPQCGIKSRGFSMNNLAMGILVDSMGNKLTSPDAPVNEEITKDVEKKLLKSIEILEGYEDQEDAEETSPVPVEESESSVKKLTEMQLLNMNKLLNAEANKLKGKKRTEFLRTSSKDFPPLTLHSIVPLMNLSELNLMTPGKEVCASPDISKT